MKPPSWRGGVEQRLQAARHLGEPDGHVVLGLPVAAERHAGHEARGHAAGEGRARAQADRLPPRRGPSPWRAAGADPAAHRLALRPALGRGLAPRLGVGDAAGDAVRAGGGVRDPAAAADAVRAAPADGPTARVRAALESAQPTVSAVPLRVGPADGVRAALAVGPARPCPPCPSFRSWCRCSTRRDSRCGWLSRPTLWLVESATPELWPVELLTPTAVPDESAEAWEVRVGVARRCCSG